MHPVTIYTTHSCPYCRHAKALLEQRNIPYEEINISGDPAFRATLSERTGMMTVPQILVGKKLVGGFQELRAMDADGSLYELLGA